MNKIIKILWNIIKKYMKKNIKLNEIIKLVDVILASEHSKISVKQGSGAAAETWVLYNNRTLVKINNITIAKIINKEL